MPRLTQMRCEQGSCEDGVLMQPTWGAAMLGVDRWAWNTLPCAHLPDLTPKMASLRSHASQPQYYFPKPQAKVY